MAFFSPFSRRPSGHFEPRLALRATQVASALAWVAMSNAHAQSLTEITITDKTPSQVSGFGEVPLSKAPFSAVNIDQQTLQDVGAQRVSDALRLDASVADSYNSPAYWDSLSVRGYTLDNRYNYRREGLPISAETMIPMDNKERIELFKGTSGIQAGTSAPGGLVNYVVKRPPSAKDETIRSLSASYGPGKSSSTGLDLGGRFGQDQSLGYRFNAAYEDLDPYTRNTQGHRQLMALAMDWRISPDTKLEWEIERSERQQLGVNGYSLLGDTLPAPADGTRNLTRQPWSVPAVFQGTTGSIRLKQNLDNAWLWTLQYGGQRLKTDDRLSYAYGCGGSFCDRFYPDGSFDLYDYRSENERRTSDAFQTALSGTAQWGEFQHHLTFSAMRHKQQDQMPITQLYSYAGTVMQWGDVVAPQTGQTTYFNTNRSEVSTELAFTDRMALTANTSAWWGLRHTQSERSSLSLDPSNPNPVSVTSRFTTPWLALSHSIAAGHTVYASYGEGVELFAAPNNANYANAGQLLGVSKSRQTEFGTKGTQGPWQWQASVFHIQRPLAYDDNFTRMVDGLQTHLGLDAGLQWTQGSWVLGTQIQWLDARLSGLTQDTRRNGQRPINTPAMSLRALAQYRFADIPGLRSSLHLSHEGARRVTEDGSIHQPSWTTLDLATHYDTRLDGRRVQWTLAIDNLADQRYWRESPKQFGHYYLYPGAPRTLRMGVKASF
ncbi:TonB-dependent siderophore receptor [Limnohabitans sp. Rim8]|uniref:TonB-dependent siderophore receptor n=1 Tax=Limnohabitans sp. Rim8 TaxID=1100718 RepID=UPI0025F26D64|nr:TonB-dependent siderophore receptor [Limnohabitans sp. Rim8]